MVRGKTLALSGSFSAYPEKLELTETILLNIILNIKPAERRAEKDKIGLFFEGANWGQYL